jgi:uncharacterized RDD family membrane protein YckC
MMYDTVREELQTKITLGAQPGIKTPAKTEASSAPAPVKRVETGGLVAPKTSPTLVEFQNKNAPLPDWRIQLQNAVKQRKGGGLDVGTAPQLAVSAATAAAPARVPAPEPSSMSDPRVASAMRRIEQSQKTFHKPEIKARKPQLAKPLTVAAPSMNAATTAAPARLPVMTPPQPRLVMPAVAPVVQKRETNKLPPIADPASEVEQPTVEVKKPFADRIIAKVERISEAPPKLDFPEATRIEIKADERRRDAEAADQDGDDIDDLAPMSMRFGAGLFDMIIAGFTSMIVLSPVAFASADWWTLTGLLVFAGTLGVVAFVYMTLCLGFYGKTMGMRLFSLELVDALENEYPTLRQAAVNTFLFLLSLPLAGTGFLAAFFNEESRAVHDLMSGTIMVKEF